VEESLQLRAEPLLSSLFVEPGVQAGVVSGVRPGTDVQSQRTGGGSGTEQLLREPSHQRHLQQGVRRRKMGLFTLGSPVRNTVF